MYFFTEKIQRLKMGFPDYIQALEEERRKIQVFCKELPLSLELVTQGNSTNKQTIPFCCFLQDYKVSSFIFWVCFLSGFSFLGFVAFIICLQPLKLANNNCLVPRASII